MKLKIFQMILCIISIYALSACAELKDTGKTIGQGTKEVTTTIGHTSRDIVQSIGQNTQKVVSDINNSSEN
ncbi:MAG: hypothetical protein ACJAZP_002349 [Psychromonas sp.]|jgi:hypothetical protein|uniref:hypothetical protein n=1 Tax=Psychromonas sp. TaxID=1884585 RepID=UPI0039E4CE73